MSVLFEKTKLSLILRHATSCNTTAVVVRCVTHARCAVTMHHGVLFCGTPGIFHSEMILVLTI